MSEPLLPQARKVENGTQSLDALISFAYIEQLQALAEKEPSWGSTASTAMKELPQLRSAIRTAHHVLDYGCGTGSLVQAINAHCVRGDWKARAMGYDPRSQSRWPYPLPVWKGRFDLVVCLDVMEHVERKHVRAVIEDIASFLTPGGSAFMGVATGEAVAVLPATSKLPERNAHITVEPFGWWLEQFRKSGLPAYEIKLTENGFWSFCARPESGKVRL